MLNLEILNTNAFIMVEGKLTVLIRLSACDASDLSITAALACTLLIIEPFDLWGGAVTEEGLGVDI